MNVKTYATFDEERPRLATGATRANLRITPSAKQHICATLKVQASSMCETLPDYAVTFDETNRHAASARTPNNHSGVIFKYFVESKPTNKAAGQISCAQLTWPVDNFACG